GRVVGVHERGEGAGRVGIVSGLVRQPDPGDGGGERVDFSGAARVLRLRAGHGGSRAVARMSRIARGEAGAVAGDGDDVHGGDEVPDVGDGGGLGRGGERGRDQFRERGGGGEPLHGGAGGASGGRRVPVPVPRRGRPGRPRP